MSSPCAKPQSKNFFTAALWFGSFGSVGSSTKVADSIGQLSSPGWSFRSIAKFCTFDQSALAAAAA